ncbi:MAG: hypothetical protein NC453_26320 [Muribaculum sp.]|nr:hypothetical protein [Muribaculum sp.]
MTIRNLAQILLSLHDLDKEVRVQANGSKGDITCISIDGNNNLTIGTSCYSADKLTVRTEIEVKSPYNQEPQIF